MKTSALCLSNCIILVCGIIIFGVGIWIRKDRAFMEQLLGTELYTTSAYILIATGFIAIIISFLGCCGAANEKQWMLKVYFLILFLIFIILLTGGIVGFVFRNEVKDKMQKKMMTTIPVYGKNKPVTDAWDAVQLYFKCCGAMLNNTDEGGGYLIWQNNTLFDKNNRTVPESCCKKNDKESLKACQEDPKNLTYEKDCYIEVRSFVQKHALILAGTAIGISLALIMGMMLTCGVLQKIKLKRRRERR